MVTILKKLRLPGSRDVVEDEVVEEAGSWDDDEEVVEYAGSWDGGEEVVEYAAPDFLSSSVEHKCSRALPKSLSKQKFLCCHVVPSSPIYV